jgi:high affinity sulfate transporter 1
MVDARPTDTPRQVLRSGPGTHWLRDYPRAWRRPDLVAGLTAAAVVVPKAMAYATVAGLPVQVGLYTAFVPMVIYALLGSSRPLSVSTTTTLAILTASALGAAAPGGDGAALVAASATLAVLVGAMLLVAAVLRLGFLADFISEPVLTGFKSGIGLVIVVDQLPKLLGVHIEKVGFLRDIASLLGHLPETVLPTLLVGLGVLALIAILEKTAPRAPAPLIAIGAAIAASSLLRLDGAGVALVGEIPRGLPSFVRPQLDLLAALWPGALGIALMSFTESIAAARAFSASDEPRPRPNRELLALGLANVGGGLVGAMPAGGGTTQTAVNRRAGARSQMAELVTAAAAVATLLLLAPVVARMPQAALAAVVVAYSVELIRPADFREIARVRRIEFWWAVIAFGGVVLLGTLRGILVAVIASLVSLAHQAYDPPVYRVGRKRGTSVFRRLSDEHPDDEQWPGLTIVRHEGRLFFANAQRVLERTRDLIGEARPSVILLDCSAIIDIEFTALKMLTEGEEKLRREDVELWLAALNPAVYAMVERSRLGQALGRERMFFHLEAAVEAYEARFAVHALPGRPAAAGGP